MSNEQDPNNIENQPQDTDELTSQDLDQVVGGTDPKPAPKPIEISDYGFGVSMPVTTS